MQIMQLKPISVVDLVVRETQSKHGGIIASLIVPSQPFVPTPLRSLADTASPNVREENLERVFARVYKIVYIAIVSVRHKSNWGGAV